MTRTAPDIIEEAPTEEGLTVQALATRSVLSGWAIQQINRAYERMLKGDVKYRFIIDLASLRENPAA